MAGTEYSESIDVDASGALECSVFSAFDVAGALDSSVFERGGAAGTSRSAQHWQYFSGRHCVRVITSYLTHRWEEVLYAYLVLFRQL